MATSKSPSPRPVIYKTVAEFSLAMHRTFDQAWQDRPDDPGLVKLRHELTELEAVGASEEAEAVLRKWYSKQRT